MAHQKILLIVSARVGDCVFCTPAIEQLHRAYPNLDIAVVAHSLLSAQVFQFNPAVSTVYLASEHPLSTLYSQYDKVIGLNKRGVVIQYIGDYPVELCADETHQHWTLTCAQFLAQQCQYPYHSPGPYRLYPQAKHYNAIEQQLKQAGLSIQQTPLIGLHMGNHRAMHFGSSILKRLIPGKVTSSQKGWPIVHYRELIEYIQHHYPQASIILTGSPGEAILAKKLKKTHGIINLIGKTSILELSALMTYMHAYITGDTGPLHLACAMNCPLITFFGITDPKVYGPYPEAQHRILLTAPHVKDIRVSTLSQQLTSLLARTGPVRQLTPAEINYA